MVLFCNILQMITLVSNNFLLSLLTTPDLYPIAGIASASLLLGVHFLDEFLLLLMII